MMMGRGSCAMERGKKESEDEGQECTDSISVTAAAREIIQFPTSESGRR
jgi:hypothetical protein